MPIRLCCGLCGNVCASRFRRARTEPLEVDMILNGSWGRWAVEIKTGPYSIRDLAGILEFCRRYADFSPLVLCDWKYEDVARQAGIASVAWPSFLLNGLPLRSERTQIFPEL